MPSASTVFVDTNVLLCAQDPRAPARQQQAAGWLAGCWRRCCGRVSTQVMNELYVNLRRTAPGMAVEDCRALVRRYSAWNGWTVDDSTVDIAWRLQDGASIGYGDALMVAAAQQQGCRWLLTEDLKHGQTSDGVHILNPFIAGPEVLDQDAA